MPEWVVAVILVLEATLALLWFLSLMADRPFNSGHSAMYLIGLGAFTIGFSIVPRLGEEVFGELAGWALALGFIMLIFAAIGIWVQVFSDKKSYREEQ